MFSSGIRFAPLEDAWSDTGLVVSPKFENPYKTEPSIIGDVDRRDITHKYIQDLYESKGARAVVSLMEPELVRDIQAMYTEKRAPTKELTLSMEDMFFIALGVLLFMYVAAE
jgi:hypothetical protein